MSKALNDLRQRIPSRSAENNKYLMLAQMMALGWTFEEVWSNMHLSTKSHKPEKMFPAVIAAAETNIRSGIPWFNNLLDALQKETPHVHDEDIANQQGDPTSRKPVQDDGDDDDDIDITSKESILKGLRQQWRTTSDPKLKSEILMKIAELQQMKKENNQEEKRHVMHFLPARCCACPCFKVAKEKYPDIETLDQ